MSNLLGRLPPVPLSSKLDDGQAPDDSPARISLGRLVALTRSSIISRRTPRQATRTSPRPAISVPPSPEYQAHRHSDPSDQHSLPNRPIKSTPVTHRTGIPIACLDISPDRAHAVLAGREIFRIIRVTDDSCFEEQNLRRSNASLASPHEFSEDLTPARTHGPERVAATKVSWAHGNFDRKIATAATNGQLVIYDLLKTGYEWLRLHEHHRQIHTLAFNTLEPAYLLSGSQDATVRLWDLRATSRSELTIHSQARFAGNSDAVRDIRWSPTKAHEFALGTDSGVIQRWDIRNDRAPLLRTKAHERACNAIDWHPDGRFLASGGSDKEVKVWDFSSSDRRLKSLCSLRAPQVVTSVCWRPATWRRGDTNTPASWQSSEIATSFDREDPRILIWDFRSPYTPCRTFNHYDLPPTALLWRDESTVWSVGSHGIFTQAHLDAFRARPSRKPTLMVDCARQGELLTVAYTPPKVFESARTPRHAKQGHSLSISSQRGHHIMAAPSVPLANQPATTPIRRPTQASEPISSVQITPFLNSLSLPISGTAQNESSHPDHRLQIHQSTPEVNRLRELAHLATHIRYPPTTFSDIETFQTIMDLNIQVLSATDCPDAAADFYRWSYFGRAELQDHLAAQNSALGPSLDTRPMIMNVPEWSMATFLRAGIEKYHSDRVIAAFIWLYLVPMFGIEPASSQHIESRTLVPSMKPPSANANKVDRQSMGEKVADRMEAAPIANTRDRDDHIRHTSGTGVPNDLLSPDDCSQKAKKTLLNPATQREMIHSLSAYVACLRALGLVIVAVRVWKRLRAVLHEAHQSMLSTPVIPSGTSLSRVNTKNQTNVDSLAIGSLSASDTKTQASVNSPATASLSTTKTNSQTSVNVPSMCSLDKTKTPHQVIVIPSSNTAVQATINASAKAKREEQTSVEATSVVTSKGDNNGPLIDGISAVSSKSEKERDCGGEDHAVSHAATVDRFPDETQTRAILVYENDEMGVKVSRNGSGAACGICTGAGAGLRVWCQRCGHVVHESCLRLALQDDSNEFGCGILGCGCICWG